MSTSFRAATDGLSRSRITEKTGFPTPDMQRWLAQMVEDFSSLRVSAKRFYLTGTALVAGDFALSAGWGAGATVTVVTGKDGAWRITVTAAGVPAANPTVILTFKDGTFTTVPIGQSKMAGGTGVITSLSDSLTATAWTVTFNGIPVAGSTYILSGMLVGV